MENFEHQHFHDTRVITGIFGFSGVFERVLKGVCVIGWHGKNEG
jgi:hypothetical protein